MSLTDFGFGNGQKILLRECLICYEVVNYKELHGINGTGLISVGKKMETKEQFIAYVKKIYGSQNLVWLEWKWNNE